MATKGKSSRRLNRSDYLRNAARQAARRQRQAERQRRAGYDQHRYDGHNED